MSITSAKKIIRNWSEIRDNKKYDLSVGDCHKSYRIYLYLCLPKNYRVNEYYRSSIMEDLYVCETKLEEFAERVRDIKNHQEMINLFESFNKQSN